MKNIISIAAAAVLMISSSVFAEGYGGGSTSTSTSASGSGAEAGASNGTNYQGVTTINQSSRGVKQHRFVPDAIAPGLTTTLTETCMGSTSGGFSVSGLGLSGGTTWTDSACIRRLDARELGAQGAKAASLERLCEDPKNRAAILRASKQYDGNFICYDDSPEGIAEANRQNQKPVKALGTTTVGSSAASSESFKFDWSDLED